MTKFEGDVRDRRVSFIRWKAPYGPADKMTHAHLYNFEQSGKFLFATLPPSTDGFDEARPRRGVGKEGRGWSKGAVLTSCFFVRVVLLSLLVLTRGVPCPALQKSLCVSTDEGLTFTTALFPANVRRRPRPAPKSSPR